MNSNSKRVNTWYKKKRAELIQQFGGECMFCKTKQGEYSWSDFNNDYVEVILEFAHKIGERISGMSRGRNARIREVVKEPHRFLLLCKSCHTKYDTDNPLTDKEKYKMNEEVPF